MTQPPPSETDPLADLLRRAALDEAPPAAVRERAVALHSTTRRAVERAAKLLRRLVAVPLEGLAPLAPFAPALGVRGGAAPAQQWLFRAEECEIDLRVAPSGERWQIAGQLFGTPQAERVVLGGGDGARSAAVGPTFEFGFADLPAGRYSLTVQGGELEVLIPDLDIGGAEPPP